MEGEKYIKNSIDLFKGQFKINGGNNFCGMKEKKIQEQGNGTENESSGR